MLCKSKTSNKKGIERENWEHKKCVSGMNRENHQWEEGGTWGDE